RYRGPSGTHKTYSAAAVIQSEIEFRNNENSDLTTAEKNADSSETGNPVDLGDNGDSVDSSDAEKTPNTSGSIHTDQFKDKFKDKYVFFSFSAPGLFDLRASPVDSVYPGVEIQATMLDNFLAGDFIRESPEYSVILWVLSWAIICALCISFLKGVIPLVLAGGSGLALPVIISFLAYNAGIWLPLVVQETASILAIFLSLGLNYASEGRQRRFIKNAFSQYLSPIFIEQLIQHPEKLKLGGERKELSIFFSDLQGFTSISENLTPENLTSFLNNYLSAMTEIIHEEGGTVDKYEGDAIIAFWNAPLDVPNHGYHAVRAALRCQKKLTQMRPEMKKIVGTDIRMRIGLNTGFAVVGNMGSYSRFDYTMLGDSVNLAARLEGANKEFGTYTMISASTHTASTRTVSNHTASIRTASIHTDLTPKAFNGETSEFVFRELARLAVVGKKEAVTVFEPMLPEDFEINRDVYTTYRNGLQLFYNGQLQEAVEIFSAIADKDSPASAYVKKCNELLLTTDSSSLQPDNWNGVWTMTSK
ncbi:MAG: adenylate/guanylate cyclase domain-containing protein, partial [Desulfamplus sp.]|nr:adenylate/guanylate cyclase domain-containing protein [Desulfamplus sp.]